MTGISIGKYIHSVLSNSDRLVSLVGDKIFPLIVTKDIEFPFVIYERNSINPSYTNDGWGNDQVTVDFIVASDNYSNTIEIAETLRYTIEGKRSKEFGIIDSRLLSADEAFTEDTYIQKLTFSFTIE